MIRHFYINSPQHIRHELTNPCWKETAKQPRLELGVSREASNLPREAHSVYEAGHAIPAETVVHRHHLLFSALSAT